MIRNREALAELLGREDDLAVVGATGGASDTLAAVRALEPDVVVVDLDHRACSRPAARPVGS